MEKQITVKGTNPIDLMQRVKAIETINGLTTQQLNNLTSLASSSKAIAHLSDDSKMKKLKMFL